MNRRYALCAAPWVALLLVACADEQPLPVRAAGDIVFGVYGDAPYTAAETRAARFMLTRMRTDDLDFVLHIGDLHGAGCSDKTVYERRASFKALATPVVYTPGDNEWADCWRYGVKPSTRLALLRDVLFAADFVTATDNALGISRQSSEPDYAEFVENARWQRNGVVFATLHVVGSENAGRPFDGRTAADDAERSRRELATNVWLAQAFEQARAPQVRALVLAMHAYSGFDLPLDHPYRNGFEPLLSALDEQLGSFTKPVLLMHGDNHELMFDQPLRDAQTGEPIDNLTRIQTFGSPRVGWLRVAVGPQATPTIQVDAYETTRGIGFAQKRVAQWTRPAVATQ